MTLVALLLDILLTIPLTFIMITIEKRKDNFLYLIIFPSIYIIVLASIIPFLKNNIFLIPIFEIFFRNFYNSNVIEEIKNNKNYLISSILSILLAIFTYVYFITKVNNILPTPEELRNIIWIIILFIIYSLIKDKDIKQNKIKTLDNKDEYILMQYAKYKNKYNLKSKKEDINTLIYSLIIYNNYQLPPFYRNIRNYLNHLLNREVRYSSLEVVSPVPMKDEQAIAKVQKELEKKYNTNDNIKNLIDNYSKEEQKEIEYIYKTIKKF